MNCSPAPQPGVRFQAPPINGLELDRPMSKPKRWAGWRNDRKIGVLGGKKVAERTSWRYVGKGGLGEGGIIWEKKMAGRRWEKKTNGFFPPLPGLNSGCASG